MLKREMSIIIPHIVVPQGQNHKPCFSEYLTRKNKLLSKSINKVLIKHTKKGAGRGKM